jgi:hypothetical protein
MHLKFVDNPIAQHNIVRCGHNFCDLSSLYATKQLVDWKVFIDCFENRLHWDSFFLCESRLE